MRSSLVLVAATVLAAAVGSRGDAAPAALATVDSLAGLARAERADLLSPGHFAAGERERDLARQGISEPAPSRNLARRLSQAEAAYRRALASLPQAREILAGSLAARDSAVAADAPRHAAALFARGDHLFREAGLAVEEGKAGEAAIKSADAERRFREAELTALKEVVSGEARRLLAQAAKEEAALWAPRTLARSSDLLAEAVRGLEENRSRRSEPLALAREAEAEAKRGLRIAALARRAAADPGTLETAMLEAEAQLKSIGEPLGVRPDYTAGLAEGTAHIVAAIEAMKAERDSLAGEIASLAAEIEKGSARERGLTAEITTGREREERLRRVRGHFGADTAVIHRHGGRLILRLKGIAFPPAKSDLLPESFGVLSKVMDAIRELPGAALTIEGHTDSQGDEAKNLALSEARAQAVLTYLETNMDLSDRLVRAVGHGEASPIASNDNDEGRAQNRRIDLLFDAANLIGE